MISIAAATPPIQPAAGAQRSDSRRFAGMLNVRGGVSIGSARIA
jgi:hypothetical protein